MKRRPEFTHETVRGVLPHINISELGVQFGQ